jgi:hypothetical protein
MKYLAFILVLTACGRGTVPQAATQAVEFSEHVEAFITAGRDRGVDVEVQTRAIEVRFGAPSPGGVAVAACETSVLHVRRITIRPDLWETMDEYRRRAILFHELGHCVLHRDHRTDVVAIMNPASVSGAELVHDGEHLIDELFQGSEL